MKPNDSEKVANYSKVGPAVLIAIALGTPVIGFLARPPDQPTARYIGELLGAEAVVLFSCSLVLATLFPVIERAFGSLDQVAIWHKRVAVAGVLLMLPHPLFAGSTPVLNSSSLGRSLGSVALLGLVLLSLWAMSPSLAQTRWGGWFRRVARISHERWLTGHRLTGLFVIAAVIHGGLVDPVLPESATLRIAFFLIGGVGFLAYVYRELLARFFIPVHDYTVAKVERPDETTVDVTLEPAGRPLTFRPGQFIFLAFGGPFGWQRHPFTIDSTPSQRQLEVTIKAVGDYTRNLYQELKTGTPAKVAGPYGTFDYREGGKDQIWIAGGVGVTPFVSWIRSMDESFDRNVVFWYSVSDESEALFMDEIEAAGQRHQTFHPKLVVTSRDGHLEAHKAADGYSANTDTWVFMCGPQAMTEVLAKGFKKLGVPANQVRWEKFTVR